MLKRPALSVLLVAAVTVASGLVGAVPAAGRIGGDPVHRRVVDVGDSIVITGETYRMLVIKDGFRYSFDSSSGATVAPAHPASGLPMRRARREPIA